MAQFASLAELKEFLKKPDGSSPETLHDDRANKALSLASAEIQGYTRQSLEAKENQSLSFYGDGGDAFFLPELPVRAVDSLSRAGTALTTSVYRFDGATGMVALTDGSSFGTTELVLVVYDSGYTTIPDDVKMVCLQRAARLIENPRGYGNISYPERSVTFFRSSETGLSPAEKQALDRYRVVSLV